MTLTVSSYQLVTPATSMGASLVGFCAFSPDGTKIAFSSTAHDLVAGDTNGPNGIDVFVKDLITGSISLISVDSSGRQAGYGFANAWENGPVWSPDGAKIAFETWAAESPVPALVPGDGWSIVTKDLNTGLIELISVSGPGTSSWSLAPSFSPDRTKIVYEDRSILMRNLINGDLDVIAQGNGYNYAPSFSPDGTKILFTSTSSNLVAGDTNGYSDIFLKDLATETITRISTDSFGNQSSGFSDQNGARNAVFSPDGTRVSFVSDANNLVPSDTNDSDDIFVKNLLTGEINLITTDSLGNQSYDFGTYGFWGLSFSPEGTKIAFTSPITLTPGEVGDTDIYVKDLVTGSLVCITESSSAVIRSGGSAWSPDGTKIAFFTNRQYSSEDTNGWYDIYIANLTDDGIIRGTSGNDTINGTGSANTIYGLGGDDTVRAWDGNDTVRGGAGDDRLYGDDGDDTLRGDGGVDWLYGGSGNDDVRGGEGNDVIYGNDGNDRLEGDDGDDTLYGGNGDDALRGEIGNDVLNGGGGRDDLRGGEGNDILRGDGGNDALYGDAGDDLLYGGSGTDKLTGGTGADGFAFDAASLTGNRDTVRDFNISEGDYLKLDGILSGFDPVSSAIADFVRLTESGGNTIVAVDTNGVVVGASFKDIARLDGVTGLDVDDLFTGGRLLVA